MSGKKLQQQGEQRATSQDKMVWSLFSMLLILAIALDVYFSDLSWAIRASVGIVVAIALTFLALATAQGKVALSFAKSARYELTRVHWPKREETIQVAFRVILMIVTATLVLWLFDTVFMHAMSWLSGQGRV